MFDDFEQNLKIGGDDFDNPDLRSLLEDILASVKRGRIVVTSRYPVTELSNYLSRIEINPLSHAETRKLFLRLPRIGEQTGADLSALLTQIGGHPRLLEFLDAILSRGKGRIGHITKRLGELKQDLKIGQNLRIENLDQALQLALQIGERDIFLEELVALADEQGLSEVLFQLGVSNLPVSVLGLTRMLGSESVDHSEITSILTRLTDLSLIHILPDRTAFTHRWTASGLARLRGSERHSQDCVQAAEYRMWKFNQDHDLADLEEGIRNFLAASELVRATEIALRCVDIYKALNRTRSIALLGSEVLEKIGPEIPGYINLAGAEADAHFTIGSTDRSLSRYTDLTRLLEVRCTAKPDRADFQRDLSVSYDRMGDIYRALGEGEKARQAFLQSLQISERLATAEPDRADYRIDLSLSLIRVGLVSGAEGRRAIEMAREILVELDLAGRLPLSDKPKIEAIESILSQLEG